MNLRTRALKGLLGTSIVTLAASGLVGVTMTGAEAANSTLSASSSPAVQGTTLVCKATPVAGATSYVIGFFSDGVEVQRSTVPARKKNKASFAKYIVKTSDVDSDITCKSAENNTAFGSPSNAIAVEGSGAPVKSDEDFVTVSVGSVLTCVPGTWEPNPTGFRYTWTRDGSEIQGQTGPTYDPIAAEDKGAKIGCTAAGFNRDGGSGAVPSANTFPVPGTPASSNPGPNAPYNQVAPSVRENVGPNYPNAASPRPASGVITCDPGEWKSTTTGASTPSYTYSWTRNGAFAANGQVYTLTDADKGADIACRVVATVSKDGKSTSSGAHPSNPVKINP